MNEFVEIDNIAQKELATDTAQSESDRGGQDPWLLKKYKTFYEQHGYIPEYFHPYGCCEVTECHPTLLANSYGSVTHCGSVLIIEKTP